MTTVRYWLPGASTPIEQHYSTGPTKPEWNSPEGTIRISRDDARRWIAYVRTKTGWRRAAESVISENDALERARRRPQGRPAR